MAKKHNPTKRSKSSGKRSESPRAPKVEAGKTFRSVTYRLSKKEKGGLQIGQKSRKSAPA